MTTKTSLFILNPQIVNNTISEKIWTSFDSLFQSLGLQKQELYLSNEEEKDPKHLIKELGIGEKCLSDQIKFYSFFNQKELNHTIWQTLISHLYEKKSHLHIQLSLSSASNLLPHIIDTLPQNQEILLHITLNISSINQLNQEAKNLELFLSNHQNIHFGTVAGEKNIFNQENNWQDIQKCYDEIVFDQTQTSFSLSEYLQKQSENEIKPETIAPVSFVEAEPFENWDVLLILESDAEKIELITKAFEVSKNAQKKSDFSNFDPIFITKDLSESLLITVKKPYDSYENLSLFERENITTLPNKLSQQEFRQLHLADYQHFKLITKYLNNESEILYDGQKNKLCKPLIAESGECIQTANETLIKTYEEEIDNFEIFFLAGTFSHEENQLLKNFVSLSEKKEISLLILDLLQKNIRYSKNFSINKKLDIQEISNLLL